MFVLKSNFAGKVNIKSLIIVFLFSTCFSYLLSEVSNDLQDPSLVLPYIHYLHFSNLKSDLPPTLEF